jgi:Predicted enzyme with a TIM-barrel fold
MHLSLQNLSTVQDKVNEIINKKQLKTEPKIIVVSKTFPLSKVMPLIESGHIHFGENKFKKLKINGER